MCVPDFILYVMITVLIHFYVRQGMEANFATLATTNAESRKKADGNLQCQLFQDDLDEAHFILLEQFMSQQSIDAYYASDDYVFWHQSISGMLDRMEGGDYQQLA